jgi:LacI family transcriptional regulator
LGGAASLRVRGINDVLGEHGARTAATVLTASQPEPMVTATGGALRAAPRPTALICLNDRIAMCAYQAPRECGISVPEDLSVVSFGNSHLAPWLDLQLTSVGFPYGELDWQAVEILLAAEEPRGAQYVPMPWIQRSSVAPPWYERDAGRERSSA